MDTRVVNTIAQGITKALSWAAKQITGYIVMGTVILFITTSALNLFKIGYDSTDGNNRSGMGLYIDNMTGCHYLAAKRGGITPRLDKNGAHVCAGYIYE